MEELQELLNDGVRFDPHYLPSMNSDHMPMTLCAMKGLGAQRSSLLAYRSDYCKILHEIRPQSPLQNWRQGIGRSETYASLFSFFRLEVASKGIGPTVAEYLPEFVSSLAMDAFHPIIRLGYAIDFQSQAETAAALAYLISSHREVPVDTENRIDLSQQLEQQVAAGPLRFETQRFSGGIRELLDGDRYPTGIAMDLNNCAALALDIYRSTRNFFALHLVTSTHAIRICSEFVDEKLALAALTGSLLAAHQVVGSPAFEREGPLPIPERLDREHAYKYAWTCLSEYRFYGDESYSDEIRGFRKQGLIPTWCAKKEIP
jgi:hypothetical protein